MSKLGKLLYSVKSRQIVQKLAAEELFNYAVKLLGIRANSIEELRDKLRRKAAQLTDVDGTIARLRSIGYLNDERFAEGFATARRDNDGFGKFRVLTDLRRRKVSAGTAEKAVTQAFAGTSEEELVTNFIERRMASIAAGGVEDEKKLAAAYRKLRRAGFATGAAITVLKRYSARPEEIEEPVDDDEVAGE